MISQTGQAQQVRRGRSAAKLRRHEIATRRYRDWTLRRGDELNAAFQLLPLVLGLAPVVLGQQVVEPRQILLSVEVVQQLAHADQPDQLHYITLHYIAVFSAGPTTTRTGPAIQVSTIILTTKTMNVESRYVNVKKVSLQPATKRCDGIDSSQ